MHSPRASTHRSRTARIRASPRSLLGLVIGGGAFIVTLLIMSMLILAVDPRDYQDKTLDRPVLYDEDGDEPSASKPSDSDSSKP